MASRSLLALCKNVTASCQSATRALAGTSVLGRSSGPDHPHLVCRSFHQSATLRKYLEIGDKHTITKTIKMEDVQTFAEVTLDKNPLHLDPEFASTTQFGKPVVHGLFSTTLLGGIVGNTLPGPGSILMGIDVGFTAPMYVGETVTVEAVIAKLQGRKVTFDVAGYNADTGKVLSKGKLYILAPKNRIRPAEEETAAKQAAS